jgi:hypothetical protein
MQERFATIPLSTRKPERNAAESATMNQAAIKRHMDVIASDAQKIGQVDHMEGSDKIKLARQDAPDGKHHLIPLNWVSKVDK